MESPKIIIKIFVLLSFLTSTSMLYAGVDKSGVKPNVLSLPSGPGSIEGLGESFEPQMNSGTATYRIPLATPPGRAGFAPQLALVYNSGNGNGFFGLGWKLDFPYIQRQTDKGQPFYTEYPNNDGIDNDKDGETDEYDEFDTFILADGEELVPTDDGYWRSENESEFLRIERHSEGWLATRKDGVTLRFGINAAARVQDSSGHIFKWYLEEMTDTNGNQIIFTYQKLDSGYQIYGTQMEYNISGSTSMMIEIFYEARPDIITDYRPRFELKTAYRCDSIQMREGEKLIRTYRLDYHPTNDLQPLSLLAAVIQIGNDGISELPPAEFNYTSFAGASAVPEIISAAPAIDLNDPDVDLIDLNTDGLPDILDTIQNPHSFYINRGPDADGHIRWFPRQTMSTNILTFLNSESVRLADMQGDGKTELLDLQGQYLWYYSIDAELNWQDQGNIIGAGFMFSDPSVQLVDVNNDKRIDVMQTANLNYFVWINLKENKWSSPYVTSSADSQIQFDRETTRLADMNGDRLQDLVHLENGSCFYYPAKGFGEYADRVTMNNPPSLTPDLTRLLLIDVNGDGLSDAVYLENNVRVWLNLGLEPTDHSHARFASSFSITTALFSTFTTFRQADLNGNGSIDIVWNTLAQGPLQLAYLDFANAEQPYQLKTITNGIGCTTTINYRSSVEDMVRDRDAGRPWPETIPFPVPVVASIEIHDGLHTYRTEYQYHDGYYDGVEKEFRGFAAAEKRDIGDAMAPDLIMAYTYDTGIAHDALKGKPLSLKAQTVTDTVFYQETYTWNTRVVASAVVGDARRVTFPYQSAKIQDVLEQGIGTPVQLKWEYAYDDYGNPTYQKEYGRMDGGWNDERITETTYTAAYPAGQAAWILDKVVETTITDGGGNRAAHKRHYYDHSSALGAITTGNLTKVEEWVSGGNYVATVRNGFDEYGNITAIYDPLYSSQPGHYREIAYDTLYHTFPVQEKIYTGNPAIPALTMTATYDYGFGVMTSSTDFNNFTTSYGYDTYGRLTAITKPPDTGHTVEYGYVLAQDVGNGQLVNWVETRQSTGGGFLTSRTFYDGLGRKIMTRADGEMPGQIVVTDTVQFNARQLPWKQYLPYFETGTLDFVEPTFNIGFTEHFYDALGRERRVNQPVGLEGIIYAETQYEPLTKIVRDEEQTNPASPHFNCGMKYVEDGLLDKDGQGRLRAVYELVKLNDNGEPAGLAAWETAYSYDTLDNLTGYTDSQQNQKFITYDSLGRKTFMNDPDRGQMSYFYDDGGNLIRTIDAKQQTIRYAYDGINRLSAEYYGANTSTPDVQYYYDLPYGPIAQDTWSHVVKARQIADAIIQSAAYTAAYDANADGKLDAADPVYAFKHPTTTVTVTAQHTRGYLSWVKDQSGEEHNSYDERGRVRWVVKHIHDVTLSGVEGLNFYTGMAYDAMDRVTQLTYPDQSTVSYGYNSRGLLEAVPGVITRYDYNPSGQNALLELANGVTTTSTYDHRLRLSRLHSIRSRDNLTLQDLSYTFDGVSNITAITEGRTNAEMDAIGVELNIIAATARKFNATQSFLYDSLYRLTQAANPAIYGTLNYRYDRIGNMALANANLLTPDALMDLGGMTSGGTAGTWNRIGRNAGDAPGPHAVTGTQKGPSGALAFTYDANGNMTTDRGMTLTWDDNDRLTGLTNGAKIAAYTYDYTGTRKTKIVTDTPTGTTSSVVYVDKFSELRDGKLLKYVYAGNNRIARVESTKAFYLADHLGSTALTLSATGTVLEQFVSYPYGHPRLEQRTQTVNRLADYTFTGKERDSESELHYFEARYLGGHIGRFVSVDVLYANLNDTAQKSFKKLLITPQKMNLYIYTGNNPLNFIDPMGLDNKKVENIIMGVNWGIDLISVKVPVVGTIKLGIEAALIHDFESAGSVAGDLIGGAALIGLGPIGSALGSTYGGEVGGKIGNWIDQSIERKENFFSVASKDASVQSLFTLAGKDSYPSGLMTGIAESMGKEVLQSIAESFLLPLWRILIY